MKFHWKILSEAAIFSLPTAVGAYFLRDLVPSKSIAEMAKLLGGVIAISGSLLGWTAGWLDQSRTLLKDVNYDAVEHLLARLTQAQRQLIVRWGLTLFGSLLVVISSEILKNETLDPAVVRVFFVFAAPILVVSLWFVFSLFRSMLASADLKAELQEFERSEARKLRNTRAQDSLDEETPRFPKDI